MTHTCQKHQPGAARCYEHCGCRCSVCRACATKRRKLHRWRGTTNTDAIGPRRRVQALMAVGWPLASIAAELGRHRDGLDKLVRGTYALTHHSTADAIAAAYDRMWRGPAAPSSRAVNRARSQGWAVPMQWDDGVGPHGIDNPAATPYVTRQREVRKDTAAEILWLARVGTPAADLAKRVGVTEEAVAKALKKAGRTDLWEAIRDRRDLFQDHTAAVRARLTKGRAA